MATPSKGKAKVKVTATGKKVSYGQAGKASDGGSRVRAGTSKGDAYCARSLGIKKGLSKNITKGNKTNSSRIRKFVLLKIIILYRFFKERTTSNKS